MPNTLQAIKSLVLNPITQIRSVYRSRTQANSVGDALEEYIKDLFADCIHETEERKRMLAHTAAFSYLGNQNHPPDLILKGGDAIETKKVQSPNSALALNSSYPKSKLYCDHPMLNNAARACESWVEKDLLFAVGHTDDATLRRLWLIYGDCFAADRDVYEKIRTKIAAGVNEIPDVEFSVTKELGRVNKVDPLGITHLRVRGMWTIENPQKVFAYLNLVRQDNDFQLISLMKKEKFDSFPAVDRDALQAMDVPGYSFSEIEIKDPNNPANLLTAIAVVYCKQN